MKFLRKALALLLVTVMAALAIGCDSSAYLEALTGVWECQEAFTDEDINGLLEASDFYAEEIAVIDVEELSFVKIAEFKADKTYRFAYDGEDAKERIRVFFTEVLADLYENREQLTELYGEDLGSLTQAEFEQGYAELYGCASYTELIEMFTENCYDYEALSADYETGTFTVDSRRIMTTIAGQIEEEYLDYTLDGDTLTLGYIDAVETYTRAK